MYFVRALLIAGCVLPAFAQYAGPAILSRGEAPSAMSGPDIDFRPFVSVMSTYTTGLATVAAVNPNGDLATSAAYGVGITFGLSGTHHWRHTTLGVYYSANFYHYNKATYYDSINQGLSMGLTHQFSRHVNFSLHENPGIFSRQFTPIGLSQTSTIDSAGDNIPSTDFYDNRTIYNSTAANLSIQKSARMSFSFGGSLFSVYRRSSALRGSIGTSASGDLQYRLSRRTTIGAMYSFGYFHTTGIISNTEVQSASFTYGVRMSRLFEFSGFGGASRVETKYIQSVPLDPAIASLLGISSTNVLTYRVFYSPTFGARVSRTFSRGVAYARVGEAVSAGNGLFYASRTLTTAVGYGYNGFRGWSTNVSGSYHQSWSFQNIQGHYTTMTGSLGIGRRLFGGIGFVSSASVNQYRSANFSNYNRLVYSFSAGFSWSPGNIPVRLF